MSCKYIKIKANEVQLIRPLGLPWVHIIHLYSLDGALHQVKMGIY